MIVRPSTSTMTIKKMGSRGERRGEAASSVLMAFMRSRPSHPRLLRSQTSRWEIYNFREGDGIETGAAYEHAVDFGLRHQAFHVVGLDAAAVKNANRVRGLFAEMRMHLLADDVMRAGRHLGRGGFARADGPNR